MSPFGIRDDQRVAVFIDGQGLYLTTRDTKWEVDFRRMHAHFDDTAMLYRIFYFTTMPPEIKDDEDEPYSPVVKLIDWLEYNGFEPITKATRYSYDSEGRRRLFHNTMYVEMAVEMLEAVPFVDHFVLFAGDSDLKSAIKAVKRRGIKVTVVCPQTAATDDLRRAADRHVDLADPAVRELLASKRVLTGERSNNRRESTVAADVEIVRSGPMVSRAAGR